MVRRLSTRGGRSTERSSNRASAGRGSVVEVSAMDYPANEGSRFARTRAACSQIPSQKVDVFNGSVGLPFPDDRRLPCPAGIVFLGAVTMGFTVGHTDPARVRHF